MEKKIPLITAPQWFDAIFSDKRIQTRDLVKKKLTLVRNLRNAVLYGSLLKDLNLKINEGTFDYTQEWVTEARLNLEKLKLASSGLEFLDVLLSFKILARSHNQVIAVYEHLDHFFNDQFKDFTQEEYLNLVCVPQ